MQTIKSYNSNIYIDNNKFDLLNIFLNDNNNISQIYIIVDENTHNYCLPSLVKNVEKLRDAEIIEIESGEESKSIEIATQIWQMLLDYQADKNALIINLGGGVISDLGGFIASQYKRGIKYINIPTTLLGMVDASIGGKVNIDLNSFKNVIGSFYFPMAILINTEFIATLNKRHFKNGLVEHFKHFLIHGSEKFNLLLNTDIQKDTTVFDEFLIQSVEIKNNIICEDPYEKGIRKTLNFGHTIGHAIESYSMAKTKKPLMHGEAVCIGIICESYISKKLNLISQEYLENIKKYLFKNIGKFDISKYNQQELVIIMENDKKNSNDSINFSLIKENDFCTTNNFIEKEMIIDALNHYNSL